MKKVLKSKLMACVLVLIAVSLGVVFAGDVIVKEGVVEGVKFKSTGCTPSGFAAVAFGNSTTASGDSSTAVGRATLASGVRSTAMGYNTTASGLNGTAMGYHTTASGVNSTAIGWHTTAGGDSSIATGAYTTAGGFSSIAMGTLTTAGSGPSPANYTTAIGTNFTNNVESSFAVGFGQVDFRVESGKVTVGDLSANTGDLYVGQYVYAKDYMYRSPFYDKDAHGRALDYSEDCSNTITLNAQGQKVYNHQADPVFLQTWITVTDYNNYTEEQVWNPDLEVYETRRTYQTHQELGGDLGMMVAWLRQCVYELKQENQALKDEIVRIKATLGIQ